MAKGKVRPLIDDMYLMLLPSRKLNFSWFIRSHGSTIRPRHSTICGTRGHRSNPHFCRSMFGPLQIHSNYSKKEHVSRQLTSDNCKRLKNIICVFFFCFFFFFLYFMLRYIFLRFILQKKRRFKTSKKILIV